jgi:hypothetical protein
MRYSSIICAIALCTASASAQEAAPDPHALIRHTPLNEVWVGDATFWFQVTAPDHAGAIVVHIVQGGPKHDALELVAVRSEGSGYALQLPAARVVPPGFSYWVSERLTDGSQRPVFADAQRPHYVRVSRTAEAEAEHQRLSRRHGQRSTVLLSAEGVDYGDRRLAGSASRLHDRYYRFEVGYAYSFLTHIEDIRLTLVRVRGEAGIYQDLPEPTSMPARPGIDYGRAAVTLLATDVVRIRTAVLLGASQRGFEYGGGGSLVLGDPRDMNLDMGVEGITTLGATAHLRLGFLANERIPMGAAVEVSTFPVGEDAGVRLLYDVGYCFGPVTALRLRGGYQGRTSVSGGPSLALAFDYGF